MVCRSSWRREGAGPHRRVCVCARVSVSRWACVGPASPSVQWAFFTTVQFVPYYGVNMSLTYMYMRVKLWVEIQMFFYLAQNRSLHWFVFLRNAS